MELDFHLTTQLKNKAGYTANTSRERVGRGGNAIFLTFRLDHHDQRTNGRTDQRTDGQSLLQSRQFANTKQGQIHSFPKCVWVNVYPLDTIQPSSSSPFIASMICHYISSKLLVLLLSGSNRQSIIEQCKFESFQLVSQIPQTDWSMIE